MAEGRLKELVQHFEDRGVAAEFCDYVLGTLVDHDRAHNSDLLHTLRVYLRCNCNAVEAAERLFLHRNSLSYRLQRIEDILKVDLKDAHIRLVLGLALEFAELMQEQPLLEDQEP